MKNTCALFTDPPGGPQVDTEATIQMTVTVAAVAPDAISQGAAASVTSTKATIGLSGPAVNIARSFGSYVTGEATDFSLAVAGGIPSTLNVAAAQPGGTIPFAQQPLVAGTPLTFTVPTSGFLPPVGPFTATGPAGSNLTADYTSLTAKVRFSDTPTGATTPYELRCVPNLAAGQTTRLATVPIAFPVAAAPKITSLDPNVGFLTGGDFVQINGPNLDAVTGVTIDGAPVPFDNNGDGTLSFISPQVTFPRTAQVRVISPAGISADNGTADDFRYVGSCAAASITSVSPSVGPSTGGTTVTIRGANLGSSIGVIFGDVAVATNLVVVSNTELRVTSPAGSGMVPVSVVDDCGVTPVTPATTFTYVSACVPPVITSVSPSSGPVFGGTAVTIRGPELAGATSVKFGAVAATGVTVVSPTELRVTAPAHEDGPVNITVSTPCGITPVTAAGQFAYLLPPPPQVTAVSPSSGPVAGGNTVTLTGSSFGDVVAVRFGAAAGTGLVHVSSTQLTIKAPAGVAGKVDITVSTAGGSSANTPADDYTYVPPPPPVLLPKITRLLPNIGLARVGGVTTIQGVNLNGVKSVKFGSKPATSFFLAGTSLVVVAPPLPPGTYPVTVTTAAGTSLASAAARYTYIGF